MHGSTHKYIFNPKANEIPLIGRDQTFQFAQQHRRHNFVTVKIQTPFVAAQTQCKGFLLRKPLPFVVHDPGAFTAGNCHRVIC